jgi:hypothetical protein
VRLIVRGLRWFALGCLTGLFVVMIEDWNLRREFRRMTVRSRQNDRN